MRVWGRAGREGVGTVDFGLLGSGGGGGGWGGRRRGRGGVVVESGGLDWGCGVGWLGVRSLVEARVERGGEDKGGKEREEGEGEEGAHG